MPQALENHQWRIAARPKGKPVISDFSLHSEAINPPQDGEVLLKTLYLGLAPVMRMYMQGESAAGEKPLEIGDVIHGRGVAEIIASQHPDFAVGEIVHGQMGWQCFKLSRMTAAERFFKCPDLGVNYAHFTGALAMTGLSAWAGLSDCGNPKPGELLVVSGAAGGVGSLVVQLGKLAGCRVIGIAGGAEKCAWLLSRGVEAAIDYKNEHVATRLKELCPDGLDIYFDNVGGDILEAALDNLAMHARIILCGSISEYTSGAASGPRNYTNLRSVQGMMKGFFVYNYLPRYPQCVAEMGNHIRSGAMQPRLDIIDGFAHMPQALMRLYDGNNIGVQCCRVIRGPYDEPEAESEEDVSGADNIL